MRTNRLSGHAQFLIRQLNHPSAFGILLVLMVGFLSQSLYAQRPAQQFANRAANSASRSPAKQVVPEPKIPRDFRPSMLRLSYDVIPIGMSILTDERSGQGFQAAVDFDQFFLAAEYGIAQTRRGESFDYQSRGWYWSLGPEVNFLRKNTKGHAITFGLRYGQSVFSDELSFDMGPTFFGDNGAVEVANDRLKAQWMEMTVGLSANVWKNIYMGYMVRYKVLRTVTGIDGFAPYDVPGFGLYEDNTGVQFNYYVGWAIQWREKFPEERLKIK